MSIKKSNTKNALKITISESLNKYDVAKYCEQLDAIVQKADKPVTVKLQDISDCDTAGLQLLISLKKSVEKRGLTLTVDDISSTLKSTATSIGLSAVFIETNMD